MRYRRSAFPNVEEDPEDERLRACPCLIVPLFGVITKLAAGAGGHFTSTLVVLFFDVHRSEDTKSNVYRPGIVGVKVMSVPAL